MPPGEAALSVSGSPSDARYFLRWHQMNCRPSARYRPVNHRQTGTSSNTNPEWVAPGFIGPARTGLPDRPASGRRRSALPLTARHRKRLWHPAPETFERHHLQTTSSAATSTTLKRSITLLAAADSPNSSLRRQRHHRTPGGRNIERYGSNPKLTPDSPMPRRRADPAKLQ